MRTEDDNRMLREVGERISLCLRERYESQRELATVLGVNETIMSRYINGKQAMTYLHLLGTASHLGVSVSYLLGERIKEDGGDLRDAFDKRIREGYEIVRRFDPRECSKMLDHLQDVRAGLVTMGALHDACGVPKATLGAWFELMRRDEWDALAKEIKNYGNSLDSI